MASTTGGTRMRGVLSRLLGPATRRDPARLPANARLPDVYRLLPGAETDTASRGPLGRDGTLALLEGILFTADEPLPGRRLAQIMGLADASAVRRQLRKLQSFYEKDGTAFQ